MRHLVFVALLSLGLLAVLPAMAQDGGDNAHPLSAAEKHRQALFDRIAPSVVFIAHDGGLGSGFFVSSSGLVLTNKHVVENKKVVKVVLIDGETHDARVISRATELDLALLKIPVVDVRPLELAGFEEVRIGSWVASIGHGAGGVWTYTTGMISNIYPTDREPVFQTQIPLNPGASGGPVIDKDGRVVGIVTAGIVESNSINFAIRSDAALSTFELLQKPEKEKPSAIHELEVRAPEGARIFVNQQMIGEGPSATTRVRGGEHRVRVLLRGKMQERNIQISDDESVDFGAE